MKNTLCGVTVVSSLVLAGGCLRPEQTCPAALLGLDPTQFGFDPVSELAEWRVGNNVVLELAVFDGKEESRFYVRCTVAGQPHQEDWPADLPKRESIAASFDFPDAQAGGPWKGTTQINWTSIYATVDRWDAHHHLTAGSGCGWCRPDAAQAPPCVANLTP